MLKLHILKSQNAGKDQIIEERLNPKEKHSTGTEYEIWPILLEKDVDYYLLFNEQPKSLLGPKKTFKNLKAGNSFPIKP